MARVTFPLFKQRLHTRMRLVAPFTFTRTSWRLGSHLRLVRMCEWLTALPTLGPLPHTSQRLAM